MIVQPIDGLHATTGPTESGLQPWMFRSMAEACGSPLVVLDLSGRVLRMNPACAQLAGLRADRAVGRPVWEVLPTVDGEEDTRLHWAAARDLGGAPAPKDQLSIDEIGNRRMIHWTYVSVAHTSQFPGHIVGTGVDVTRQHIAETIWRRGAETDPLTGLANRAAFQASLAEQADPLNGLGCGVLFCDLDGFKGVNDTFGHSVGDEVLVHVAARLTAKLRVGDLVARFGGGEFAAMLPAAGLVETRALSMRLERSIRIPLPLSVGPVRIGASIGLAVLAPGDDPSGAVRVADAALYKVKFARAARRQRTIEMTGQVVSGKSS